MEQKLFIFHSACLTYFSWEVRQGGTQKDHRLYQLYPRGGLTVNILVPSSLLSKILTIDMLFYFQTLKYLDCGHPTRVLTTTWELYRRTWSKPKTRS